MSFKREQKKILWVLISGIVLGLIAFFIWGPNSHKGSIMKKYAVFISKNPALNFAFEYPEQGWRLRESQGRTEKYDAIYLSGPFDAERRFVTLAEIVVKPLGTEKEASRLLEIFMDKASKAPKFKMIAQNPKMVGGEKAFSASYETELRLPMENRDAKLVKIREQNLFLVRKDKSYRIAFHTLADQDKENAPVFEHILKTFRFAKEA